MKNIICVPIEPLSERYTESWYRNFPTVFQKDGWNVSVIDGEPILDNDIKTGTFLDIGSTCHYKATQLQKIAKMFSNGEISDGSIFFFFDLEFWGIEQVRLLADMYGVSVKLTAFLHAASYTIGDAFEIASPYQRYTELGWIAAMDKVYVGSEYHKKAIIDRRLKPNNAEFLADKIVVTKNPLFIDDYKFKGLLKQKRMLLTNRLDKEKNPVQTVKLFLRLKQEFPDWEFIITSSRKRFRTNMPYGDEDFISCAIDMGKIELKMNLTKEEYHEELEQAAIVVSHSPEENYGICIAESLIYKCLPLLKDCASHPEFVVNSIRPESFLFVNEEKAYYKAKKLMYAFETKGCNIPIFDPNEGLTNILDNLNQQAKVF